MVSLRQTANISVIATSLLAFTALGSANAETLRAAELVPNKAFEGTWKTNRTEYTDNLRGYTLIHFRDPGALTAKVFIKDRGKGYG